MFAPFSLNENGIGEPSQGLGIRRDASPEEV
jgi:hypothetical protein